MKEKIVGMLNKEKTREMVEERFVARLVVEDSHRRKPGRKKTSER